MSCSLFSFIFISIQCRTKYFNKLCLFIHIFYDLKCFFCFLLISKTQNRKKNSFPMICKLWKFIIHSIDWMIIIGYKQNCPFIEKSSHDRIYNSIRFSCSWWSLNIRYRIFHSIMNCQQLIQIHIFIQQCHRICACSSWSFQQISKKCFHRYRDFPGLIHFYNRLILFMKIKWNFRLKPNQIWHIIY